MGWVDFETSHPVISHPHPGDTETALTPIIQTQFIFEIQSIINLYPHCVMPVNYA